MKEKLKEKEERAKQNLGEKVYNDLKIFFKKSIELSFHFLPADKKKEYYQKLKESYKNTLMEDCFDDIKINKKEEDNNK